jgi:hypothetical protein
MGTPGRDDGQADDVEARQRGFDGHAFPREARADDQKI